MTVHTRDSIFKLTLWVDCCNNEYKVWINKYYGIIYIL